MAPPHTRVCASRHISRQATFLACVTELGETGSFLKPARCDDPTQTISCSGLIRPQFPGRADKEGQEGQGGQSRAGQGRAAVAGGGEAEPLTAQMGLYSTILHRLHPLFGPCWASSVLEQVGI